MSPPSCVVPASLTLMIRCWLAPPRLSSQVATSPILFGVTSTMFWDFGSFHQKPAVLIQTEKAVVTPTVAATRCQDFAILYSDGPVETFRQPQLLAHCCCLLVRLLLFFGLRVFVADVVQCSVEHPFMRQSVRFWVKFPINFCAKVGPRIWRSFLQVIWTIFTPLGVRQLVVRRLSRLENTRYF